MKKIIESILMSALIIFAFGCQKVSKEADASTSSKKYVVVILIDGSKSYKFLDQAKKTVVDILEGLPAGSLVYVRWISSDSIKDDFSIVSAVFPEEVKGNNAFDVKNKRKKQLVKAKDLKVRKQVITIISKSISPKSNLTDIYGALYSAGERFKLASDHIPLLCLITDMEDTAGKEKDYEISLQNVDVKILGYQVGNNDVALKNHWTQWLTDRGAAGIYFSSLDNPESFQLEGGI
jgi:hypothetical protein